MKTLPTLALVTLCLIYYIWILGNINIETLKQIQINIEQKMQLKMIVENIEESLITIHRDKIRQTNQQFKNMFSDVIIDQQSPFSNSTEHHNDPHQHCFKRFSKFLKSFFKNSTKPVDQDCEDIENAYDQLNSNFLQKKLFTKF